VEDYSIAEWFQLYEVDITSFLVYYTGSLEVEDLVQDTFLIAMRKLSTFNGKSHPKTWLISIARNLVIDRYRRTKVWEKIKYILSSEHPHSSDLEDITIKKFDNIHLYNAINLLSSQNKEVVILRGILELSSKETSDVLKCSQNKVNVMYHRSLKKLKELLEKEGFYYEGSPRAPKEPS
jgi:RNA polymerase sigma-70 factor (ECF subfamily)